MFIKGLYYSYTNDKMKAINYFDSSLHMDFTYMFSYREKAIAIVRFRKISRCFRSFKKSSYRSK